MMSLRAFLALLLIYIVYLVIGGFTFRATENEKGCEGDEKSEIDGQNLTSQIGKLIDLLREGKLNETHLLELVEEPRNVSCTPTATKWDFYNSLFFSFTAVTTIGNDLILIVGIM